MNGLPGKELLLEVSDLRKEFSVSHGFFSSSSAKVRAVDGVNLKIYAGETLGLVGESGCGKTTLGKMVLRLIDPSSGSIKYRGQAIDGLRGDRLREYRRQVQMIFQDPHASLNPRRKTVDIIREPLIIHGLHRSKAENNFVRDLVDLVGITTEQLDRYPHEFSGGQRQRIGIARALVLRPSLVVTDEPVSSLDVSIQAQILNLLKSLQERFHLTYVFITHNLSVVRYMADRIAVMYLGRIVELADKHDLFQQPCHPYTRILLQSIPQVGPGRRNKALLSVDVPSSYNPPAGCSFHPRCPEASQICSNVQPDLVEASTGHIVACHGRD